ncbi:MAG: hypothetical protein ABI388_11740 [Bacteroidia bacterium]
MKGRRLIVLISIVFACQLYIRAQDTLSGYTVEQKSLDLYIAKKWKELTAFGNEALHKGYDYYYMQMRVGIAYYERKNYCLAESHFRKALQFSSNDSLALEYIYYCYIFTGRNEDARKLSKKFNRELATKTGTNTKSPIDFVIIEGGTKISDSSTYFKPAVYFQAGLSHTIKNKVSFFHAATYFHQQNIVGTLTQLQYYLRATIPVKKNWLISPSFHLVNINFSSETPTTTIDTLWPPGVPPHTQPPPGAPPFKTITNTSYSTRSTNSIYFVGSFAIQKIIKRFTLTAGSTISNISNTTEFINNGALYYSVLGNSKLVLGCAGYLHSIDNYKTTYASVAPFVYVQPTKSISIKLSYLYNRGNNIIESNGYFINNSPDLTKSRIALLANFNINKSIALYATYQLENKLENIQQFNYHYNVIVVGIKIVP